MIGLFCFLSGLILGSFVNVCIWRIPKRKSIIYPFSACPKCGKYLSWYDNLPISSYLLLKGRCRHCKEKISWQYPLVELLTGLVFLLLYLRFSFSINLLFALVLSIFLLIASGIDYFHWLIPNKLTYTLILSGILSSFFNPFLNSLYFVFNFTYSTLAFTRFLYSLSSSFLAGGFLYIIGLLGEKIFRKEALGGGDVKLLAGIGAFLGIFNTFWIVVLASIIGTIGGLIKIFSRKLKPASPELQPAPTRRRGEQGEEDTLIPFAPYLSIATFITLLFLT